MLAEIPLLANKTTRKQMNAQHKINKFNARIRRAANKVTELTHLLRDVTLPPERKSQLQMTLSHFNKIASR